MSHIHLECAHTIRHAMHSYHSNRTEVLFRYYKENCFQHAKPFQNRLVIVPSPSMKSWLMLQMASDPDLGIAMGVNILYLNQALQQLQPFDTQTLNEFELAFAIEIEIRKLFSSWPSLSQERQALWRPLFHYLKVDSIGKMTSKGERRLVLLCSTLSSLFNQYGIYGGKVVEEWQDEEEWQKELWRILFEKNGWNYPYRSLKNAIKEDPNDSLKKNSEIHLFALSFLPKIWFDYFAHLSEAIPTHIYLLSPCQAFWTDILSDKQSQKLLSRSQKKGASITQLQELELYLRDRNPLLANFGRLGKEMALHIEDSHAQSLQEFVLPKSVFNSPHYSAYLTSDLICTEDSKSLSMLQMVQADIVLLRNPEEKIEFENHDSSIQFHFSTDKLREIQNLHNTLLGIIQKHENENTPILPKEILVMAPNINEYAPYIDYVFKGGTDHLEAKIMDLSVPRKNAFIRSFLHLISLPFTRWDASHLLQLINSSPFQSRLELTKEETHWIQDWIKRIDVRWGIDAEHRDELLKTNHCSSGMLDKSEVGTWEEAFHRLLNGLIFSEEETASSHIDATQGLLLGKWIHAIRSLQSDLSPLQDGTELTLTGWTCYLKCLIDSYLKPEDKKEEHILLSYLEDFAKTEKKLSSALFPFSTIKHHLENSLNRSSKTYNDNRLHAVSFCSLLPMRAIPSRVIAIIGMAEDSYPKKTQHVSLNLLLSNKLADFSPTQTDYDRFLYLETLLSARDYFLLSYQGMADENDKEQGPSLLITELMNYLDNACCISGEKPSVKCFYNHPALSFDPIYFNGNSHLRSFSETEFCLAKAFLSEKRNPLSFLSDFPEDRELIEKEDSEISVDIKEIESVANNPLKAFLNKKMGVYIDKKENRIVKNEEDFYLNPLQKYMLKKNCLNSPLDEIIARANKEGKFPLGGFKNSAIDNLQKEILSLKGNLAELGVHTGKIFSIISSDDFSCVEQCENGDWHLPPLKMSYFDKGISLTGTLHEVSVQGLISHSGDSKQDLIKRLPQYLFFHCLLKTFALPIKPHLLLLKGAKGKIRSPFSDDPFKLLHHFIHFHFIATENPFPLIPEWICYFLEASPEEIEHQIKESIKNPFKEIYNEEIKWIFHKENSFSACSISKENWILFAKDLYSELYMHW